MKEVEAQDGYGEEELKKDLDELEKISQKVHCYVTIMVANIQKRKAEERLAELNAYEAEFENTNTGPYLLSRPE